MPRPQPPAGFVAIGPEIYISLTPVSAAALQPTDSAPNVIIILGWMGATTRHLQKYSEKYVETYPHATQIIVKCEPASIVNTARGQQERLTAVVEALESLGCLPTTTSQSVTRVRPRILVHSFSNGGGFQLLALGNLISRRYPSVSYSELPVSALVIDSSPCAGNFRTLPLAFTIAIRNPVILAIVGAFISLIHALRLSIYMVSGVETMGLAYPKLLLRPRILPWMNSQTPRLYVFSKKDKLVPWKDVQQHIVAAKASGLNVRWEIYEESVHVAHMLYDPERYWASIRDVWQVAYQQSRVQAVGPAGGRCML